MTPRKGTLRVLMVCTGNICRSPTAEGMLRHLAAQQGLAVEVDSAGTTAYHQGEPPDKRSQTHALRRGIDLSQQRARPLRADDFVDFDWLLAMDEGHLAHLQRACPHALKGRVALLLDFAPGCGTREVPDPYYGGASGFEKVLDLVEQGCTGFLRHQFGPV